MDLDVVVVGDGECPRSGAQHHGLARPLRFNSLSARSTVATSVSLKTESSDRKLPNSPNHVYQLTCSFVCWLEGSALRQVPPWLTPGWEPCGSFLVVTSSPVPWSCRFSCVLSNARWLGLALLERTVDDEGGRNNPDSPVNGDDGVYDSRLIWSLPVGAKSCWLRDTNVPHCVRSHLFPVGSAGAHSTSTSGNDRFAFDRPVWLCGS